VQAWYACVEPKGFQASTAIIVAAQFWLQRRSGVLSKTKPYIIPVGQCPKRILGHTGAMRILDLGCGSGLDLASWGVTVSDEVTGLDIDENCLVSARVRFPNRTYIHGAGESLPFNDGSFDRVISAVALPYMNIQKTLAEIRRVLVPGGRVSLSLHLPSFTIAELLHNAVPKPIPTLFRLYVMANGMWFYCTGKTIGFVNTRTESFQTERGMRIALTRAGFVNSSFTRRPGPVGEMFIVEASSRT
jgi:SAM-dependent methyltransferase